MNRQLNIIISKLKPTRNTSVQGIDALKYAWPALRLTLTTFEKILDGVPIPGLKGAIGGFLELVKNEEVGDRANFWATLLMMIQTLIQNSEDILGIQKQIMDLACIFKQWDGIHKLPQELEPRIQTFIEWVHFYWVTDIGLSFCPVTFPQYQLSAMISSYAILFAVTLLRWMTLPNFHEYYAIWNNLSVCFRYLDPNS